MKEIYFSVDPEVVGEPIDDLRLLWKFLTSRYEKVHRADYVFAENPEEFLSQAMGFQELDDSAKRDFWMGLVEKADLVVADISAASPGRWMVIEHALSKPRMGLPATPIILIKYRGSQERFGSLVNGPIEQGRITYFEYNEIQEVIDIWDRLIGNNTK